MAPLSVSGRGWGRGFAPLTEHAECDMIATTFKQRQLGVTPAQAHQPRSYSESSRRARPPVSAGDVDSWLVPLPRGELWVWLLLLLCGGVACAAFR
jgi:hypothetical protein